MSAPQKRDPFKPSFGSSPPLLAGRDDVLLEFAEALDNGPGAAGRATLYTGARGAGKTVMLNAVEEEARTRGWIVVSETVSKGVVDRLTQSRLPEQLRKFDPDAVRHRLNQLSAPLVGGGVGWENLESHIVKVDLRGQIELLTDLLAEGETGLLLTFDEIHRNPIDELREIATVAQHSIREDRELAFAAAGLSSSVSDLLQDDVLTFLRRADNYHLGAVDLNDVRIALEQPILESGLFVDPDALDVMVDGTHGYPFLIQLVGSRCWRLAARRDETIGLVDAERGVADATKRLGALVHSPALKNLSAVDRSFLLAMAKDDGPSRISDIATRLNDSEKYAGVYRSRLIDAELIESTSRGYVDFTLPYLREYLREHVASEVER